MTNDDETNVLAPRARPTLDSEAQVKIKTLLEQVRLETKGVKIRYNDLVNWIIKSHRDKLNSKELRVIKKQFYDRVTELQQQLDDAKKERALGQQPTHADVQKLANPANRPSSRRLKANIESAHQDVLSADSAHKISSSPTSNSSNS